MSEDFDLRTISLGAGWQSSAMYIMAAEGMFEHMPDAAIFADTQAEPAWVYENLDRLEAKWGHIIPIRRCTMGSLEKNLYFGGEGRDGFVQIPAFLKGKDDKRGIGRRQCTYQYKLRAIIKETRDMLGLRPRQRAAGRYRVEQWIGISTDEAHRAKPAAESWMTSRHPLLFDIPTPRYKCQQIAAAHGIRDLLPSSCYFCPYHSNAEWRLLRERQPELWEKACQIDRDLRNGVAKASEGLKKQQYLHSSLQPLDQVDIDVDSGQPDLFGNECEGMCGV